MQRKGSGHVFNISMLGGEYGTQMSCQDANCQAYAEGWVTVLDTSDDKMAGAATWIKQSSRRKFYEWDGPHALDEAMREQSHGRLNLTPELRAALTGLGEGMVVFMFHRGQQCFKEHLDREVKFHHVKPGSVYEHVNGRDFNEDSNETADRLHILRKRG